jgi:rhodanese-related sulfurtransferase
MHWTTSLLPTLSLAAFFWPKRTTSTEGISVAAASTSESTSVADLLREGALVIDVRSPAEFASEHLPEATNLPLDLFAVLLPQHVADRDKNLLLHCHAGMRSASAKTIAEKLGYTNVINLGSYGQADQALKTARG